MKLKEFDRASFLAALLLASACSSSSKEPADVAEMVGDVLEVGELEEQTAVIELEEQLDLVFPDVELLAPETEILTDMELLDMPDVQETSEVLKEEELVPVFSEVGKPCESDFDCNTTGGCLLGFCTAVCRVNDEIVPGACENSAPDSPWGPVFGCPIDVDVCMPGEVLGKEVVCNSDAQCKKAELDGFVCAGAFTEPGPDLTGRCLPMLDRKPAGAPCLESGDVCGSLICTHPDNDANLNGICSLYCDAETICPAGSVCTMYPVADESGNLLGYAPLCAPFKGSLKKCETSADCKPGKEYCGVVFGPGAHDPVRICMESKALSGALQGESCSPSNPCFGPWCLFEPWAGKVDAYCSHPCNDDSECTPSTSCRQVHVDPYEGYTPESPFVTGICLKVSQGSPCFTSETGACLYEWSKCEPMPEFGWLGTCVDGECVPQCEGKFCKDDDGCGNPCLEPCIADGEPCKKGVECLSGFCVDGVCCSTPCDGVCMACNLEGSQGTCTPIPDSLDPLGECGLCKTCNGQGGCRAVAEGTDPGNACGQCMACSALGECAPISNGTDPENECPPCETCDGAGACAPVPYGFDPKNDCAENPPETCSTTGVCDGLGACELWAAQTPCSEAKCVGSSLVPQSLCNGKGACLAQQSVDCKPYQCDPESLSCLESCDDTLDCAAGFWCVAGECKPLPACPGSTKLPCNVQYPVTSFGYKNDWWDYGCVPGIAYNGPEKKYSVKFDKTTKVNVSVKDANFDAALILLQHACAPKDACLDYEDTHLAGGEESLSFTAQAGVQYYLVVDGVSDQDKGDFLLVTECCELKCAPVNPCGSDGCGGSCGSCQPGEVCSAGTCFPCEDDPSGEPNESCMTAAPIEPGNHQGFFLCPEGDMDWFEINLKKGETVSLQVEFDATTTNIDIALYGPECKSYVMDSTSPDSNVESIEFLAQQDGTWHLLVYSADLTTASYNLNVKVVKPECTTDKECTGGKVCGLYKCVPPPTQCGVSGALVCESFVAGDTSGKSATWSDYAACTASKLEGPEEVYSLMFEQNVVVTVKLEGQAFLAGLALLEKYCASSWACKSLTMSNAPGTKTELKFKATKGTPYYVVVDGKTPADSGDYSLAVDCCIPVCDGKECGDDGCGLDCGKCPADNYECVDGKCICIPNCQDKQCGDDGCGGSCGDCPGPQDACIDGMCVCQPTCEGKECGDDGCGGTCGECQGKQEICIDNKCICQPACEGIQCGDDGCGGSCGDCPGPQDACIDGICVCQPTCEGKECGDDGCGGNCGECTGVQEACVDFQCVCQPACEGVQCGDDGCGGVCGTCLAVQECKAGLCVCLDDFGWEPNDGYNKATPIKAGKYEGIALCPGDYDWYSVDVKLGAKLTVSITFVHDEGDLDLFLFKYPNFSQQIDASAEYSNTETVEVEKATTSKYMFKVQGADVKTSNLYTLEVIIQ